MPHPLRRFRAHSALIVVVALGAVGRGDQPDSRVSLTLNQMYRWLGTDRNAASWRKFLRSQDLQIQLLKRNGADPDVVSEIQQIYSGDTAGLDRRRFVAVREALEAWHEDLTAAAAVDIAGLVREATSGFRPIDPARVAELKSSLREAVSDLDRFLDQGGDRGEEELGRESLKWDLLEQQLADNAEVDITSLTEVWQQFDSGAEGLEQPAFSRVRRALLRYAQVARLTQDPNGAQIYAEQLEQLATSLESYAQQPNAETAAAIGTIVQWLDDTGLAPQVVAQVRRRYGRPNLFVRVSEPTVSAALGDQVEEPTPVRDVILGTLIRGQGVTRARIAARLIPSTRGAALDLLLDGTTEADTIGYNGPVRIISSSVTTLAGRKRLLIDTNRIDTEPARACCDAASSIRCISAGNRLGRKFIERIAWKRAFRDKSRAERIASRHAEGRLADRMNDQAATMVQDANQRFSDRIADPLEHASVYPKQLELVSTDDAVWLAATQANSWQLAAAGMPGDLAAEREITAWVHDSLINNTTDTLLAGMTLSDERLVELLQEQKLDVPEELKITPEKEPWAITFARRHPFRIVFDGDTVTMALRGRRFLRADQGLEELVEISATYKMGVGRVGVKLTRQGDVEVEFLRLRGRRLNVSQIGFKTFMRRKFSAMFREEFESEGIQLPEKLQQRLGQLRLKALHANGGWLTVAWDRSHD